MSVKYYLVDTENVGTAWIQDLANTAEEDKIVLFYTDLGPKYKETDAESLYEIKARLSWEYCHNGTANALDFTLSTWLGSKAAAEPDSVYEIVSNDKGYTPVCMFWQEHGVSVNMRKVDTQKKNKDNSNKDASCITSLPGIPAEAVKKTKDLMKQQYRTQTNIRMAYHAICSGDLDTIHRTVNAITSKQKDAQKMERNWISHIKCMQKIAG